VHPGDALFAVVRDDPEDCRGALVGHGDVQTIFECPFDQISWHQYYLPLDSGRWAGTGMMRLVQLRVRL